MKNKYITVILALSMTLFSGCSWLDVHPVDEVDKASMYASTEGFYNVLNGVYLELGESALYGDNLSWGSMEAWGRGYQLDKTLQGHKKYYSLQECKYDDKDILSMGETIWSNAYRNIARLNDFIQQANLKDDDFFTHGVVEKNVLIGEARGLRALLHFDLYRIFGQSPLHPTDAAKAYVPYVEVYPSKSNPPTPVETFLQKVNADLESAAELVGSYDSTSVNKNMVLSKDKRFSDEEPEWGRFYSQRGVRLNYYAIRLLQARVAMYQGNYEAAQTFAQEIKDLVDEKLLGFVTTSNIVTAPKLMDETLFAFYNELLKEATQDKFDYKLPASFKVEDANLFSKVNGDKRKDLISNKVLTLYTADPHEKYIPGFRISEAYFTIAECQARSGNVVEAVKGFNEFRKKRGVYSSSAKVPEDITEEEFINVLIEDAKREFAGLGQNVFIYKRLNKAVTYSEGEDPDTKGNLRIDVPQSESAI